MALALAVLGALLIAAGVALVHIPAAMVVAGLQLVAAGYVARYMSVNGGE